MTEQEAINVMEKYKHSGSNLVVKAHNMAIAALEKQIQKKPNMEQKDSMGVPIERCPSCFSFGILEYCAKCGQKLDWSE